MNANATSAEAISRVEFSANDKLIFADTTAPYSFNWQAAAPGTYTLQAKAFNVQGTMATSAPVTAVVVPPAEKQTALMQVR